MKKYGLMLIVPLLLIVGCYPWGKVPITKTTVEYTVSIDNTTTEDLSITLFMNHSGNYYYDMPVEATPKMTVPAGESTKIDLTYYYSSAHSNDFERPNIMLRAFSGLKIYNPITQEFIADYMYPYSQVDREFIQNRASQINDQARLSIGPPNPIYEDAYPDDIFYYGLSWEATNDPNFSERLFVAPADDDSRPFYLQRDTEDDSLGRVIITKVPTIPVLN